MHKYIKPKIGVIIVNFNGYEDTNDCCNSLLKSNYSNLSIYIVDNNSSNSEIEKLKTLEIDLKVNLIYSDDNIGFSGGNNLGAKHAIRDNCDYLLFLNNDTVVRNDSISKLVDGITNSDDILTGKIMYYSEPQKIWYAGGTYNWLKGTVIHYGGNETNSEMYESVRDVSYITGCYVFVSVKNYLTLGKWSEEYFLYCEDCDLSLKAHALGIKIRYLPESVIYHKVSSSTSKISSLAAYYTTRNRLYIIRKFHRGINKATAFVYSYLVFLKAVLIKRQSLAITISAITDFYCNNMSKRKERMVHGKE